MDEGTHFAAPTEGSIIVAEELRRRWGLPHWRFTNSGTESTMDAVHLARGFTGRDVDRQDRGHLPRPPRRRDGLGQAARRTRWATARSRTRSPYGLGFAPGTAEHTRVVPFNDADALGAPPLDGQRGRRDHGAGDDEHQHRPAGRRLPRAGPRAHARARRRDDLRRGQDRRGRRRRRRDRAVRRHARRRLPGQGDLRRPPGRRDRHDRRARRAGRGGQVKQQGTFNGNPLDDGRRAGDAARRPHRPRPTRSCTPPTRS